MFNSQILLKMKKVVNFQMLAAILMVAMMSFAGCKKDNGGNDPEDPNNPGGTSTETFKIKQATIEYDLLEGLMHETLIFDDNGKKMRLEDEYHIYLLDENAKKSYDLNKSSKTYEEKDLAFGQGKRKTYIMTINDANFASAGYKKTTETIAGKSCTVYTGGTSSKTVSYGTWNDIVFLMTLDGGDVMRATSFSDAAVAASSFTIPSDYTKK